MDAVLFLKEKERMCRQLYTHCSDCQLSPKNNDSGYGCEAYVSQRPEEAVYVVEQWSKENPPKTKKDKFFEVCPNAPKTDKGYPIFGLPVYVGLCEKHLCSECGYGNTMKPLCWDTPYEGGD